MVTADSARTTKPECQGESAGDLVLRVLGPQYRGRLLRLSATKCTIGAAPHCTLRLRARGVRPLHCLILRGVRGTYIRRWSPDTTLNGHAFDEARLGPGDRLHIGPIALQVEQTAASRSDPPLPPDRGSARELELTQEIAELNALLETSTAAQTQLQAKVADLTAELKSESQRLLQQLDQANETIRSKTAQISELEARFASMEPLDPARTQRFDKLYPTTDTPPKDAE